MNMFRIMFFFILIWGAFGTLVQVASFAVAEEIDRADHNMLIQSNVISVDDVEFGNNPVQTGIELFGWVDGTAQAIFRFATFSAPFWVGDLAIVRWIFLGALGSALMIALGFETVRLVRG